MAREAEYPIADALTWVIDNLREGFTPAALISSVYKDTSRAKTLRISTKSDVRPTPVMVGAIPS